MAKEEANFIITRGASSRLPKLKALPSWCSITEMPVEIAISKLSKMKVIKMSNNVVKDIKKALAKHSVYVQVKGPDAFAHRGNILGKVKAIELIDKYYIKPLIQEVDLSEIAILITSDHATPPKVKAHTDDPVPFIISWRRLKPDGIERFTEKECMYKGSLSIINHGYELLPLVFNILKN